MTTKKFLIKCYAWLFLRPMKLFSRSGISRFFNDLALLKGMSWSDPKSININIGSGGDIASRISKLGIKSVSVDIDPSRKPDVISDAHNLSFLADHSVDTIFFFEVLEHCHSPFVVTGEFQRVLRPGGMVVGSTPFLFPLHDLPHDYFRFTKKGLESVFKGFEKVRVTPKDNYADAVALLFLRGLMADSIKQRLFAVVLFPFNLIAAILMKMLSPIYSPGMGASGYVFIFQKPAQR
jgi:SAM-dependent methyltransferase